MKKCPFNPAQGMLFMVLMVIMAGCSEMDPDSGPAPSVLSVYPADGAVAVPSDTSIHITFDMPMDTASCEARFFAFGGNMVNTSHMMMHAQAEIPGHFNWNDDFTEMMFHPDSILMDSTMYTYHLESGMESREYGDPMMMSGMIILGRELDDGISCTFTTVATANDNSGGTSVATPSIKEAPYYFSFTTGAAVSGVPDVILKMVDQSYMVALNAAANISAAVRDSGDFASATYGTSDMPQFDSDTSLVIGDGWMDISTYTPIDHSISNNGTFYFVRTADYSIVKLLVDSGTPTQFNLKVAVSSDGSSFPAATDLTFAYSADAQSPVSLTSGTIVADPGDWHIGLITAPVAGAPFPMQSVVINYENSTQVGVVSGQAFDAIDAAPADIVWLSDTGTIRPLAYTGSNEVITYSGAPDHTVYIVDPDLVYIINTSGGMYKLQIVNYDQPAGIVEFTYAAL